MASNGDTASTTGTMTIHVVPQASVISSASSASITIVSGSGGTANASSGIVIDWGGTLLSLLTGTPVRSDEWVSGLFPPLPQLSLAEQTGLVVRIE